MITCNNKLKILFILLICGTVNCFIDPTLEVKNNRDDYIDPHSIYYNKYTQQLNVKKEIQTHSLTKISKECPNNVVKKNDIPDELFSRKFVNLLLSAASFEENENLLTSSITIELTRTELRKLKDFTLGKLTVREIDPVVVNIFKLPEISFTKSIFTFVKEIFFHAILYKEVTLVVVIILYISWVILTTKWNMLKIILIILLSVFAASFIITWLQLLREAEIKLTVKQVQYAEVPIQCNPNKMSWWDKLWTAISSGDECKRYYEAMMENPFLQVTPAQALSQTLATCVLTPVSMIGDALGDFVNNSTRHLYWPFRMIVAPILIIGIIIITVMTLIILSGGSLSWGFGPFSIFSLRGRTSSPSQSISSTDRQPIQPVYNFHFHGEHKPEIAIKNTAENASSVDVKATPVPGSPNSFQLENKSDVRINVIEPSTSTSLENIQQSEEVVALDKVETTPEKSKTCDVEVNDECACKKKSNPVSESGDS